MAELSSQQKKYLRGLGMGREPEVLVGKSGLTAGINGALRIALARHQLVKVRFAALPREERQEMARLLAEDVKAELCGVTGHTALYFKEPSDPAESLLNPAA